MFGKVISLILFNIVLIFYSNAQTKFPIIGWNGIPEKFSNDLQYKNLYNSGINISIGGFTSIDEAIKALKLAEKFGVKLILNFPELFSNPEKSIPIISKYNSLYGYYLRDEPSYKDFSSLKKLSDKIKEIDPTRICYINLFPNYAGQTQLGVSSYEEYIVKFKNTFNYKINSFDNYPIVNGEVRKNWYQNLEVFKKHMLSNSSSFWGFAMITSFRSSSENISLSHLRLQVFSNLAYGAKGIQFFTYWTPNSGPNSKFFNGPISSTGEKNPSFNKLTLISKEILGLSKIFYSGELESVYHTNNELGTVKYNGNYSSLFKFNEVKVPNLLISKFISGNKTQIIIVNKNISNKVTISLEQMRTFRRFFKSKSSEIQESGKYSYSIGPGDILIFEY